ncbi:hypothetical protein B7494_g1304 [Chlorociboria aeruginascens]|nr:hypothetical protein B7494_g1304 [Chlorociboria aeruginascens]
MIENRVRYGKSLLHYNFTDEPTLRSLPSFVWNKSHTAGEAAIDPSKAAKTSLVASREPQMDPLSLTASIIAIVGAGGTLMKGLKKLQDLKDAKEDIDDLILELSRLRYIILQIATAFEGPRVTTATSLETMLVEALNTGKTSATDLNTIIQNEVLKIPNKQGTVEIWSHNLMRFRLSSSAILGATLQRSTTPYKFLRQLVTSED